MSEINDWSTSAAANNGSPPDGYPENMNYSEVNNTGRENMAVLARYHKDTNGSIDAGGVNDITVTTNGTYSALFQGMRIGFKAANTNTGAATLTVNALPSAALLSPSGAALTAGDIQQGIIYQAVYNGANFQLASGAVATNSGTGFFSASDATVTPTTADKVAIKDASDSDNPKFSDISDLVALLGGGSTTFTGLTDTPANFTGQAGNFLQVNVGETALEFTAAPGGTTTFVGLTDTPANFTGAALQSVRVNAGETALEFFTPSSGATTFTGLTDTPANFTGASLQAVRVNAGETALEFYTPAAGGSQFTMQMGNLQDAGSAGAQAFKGEAFFPSANITIHKVGASYDEVSGEDYKAVIATLNGSGDITAIVSSATFTATQTGRVVRYFDVTDDLVPGTEYACMVGRTDGVGTDAFAIASGTAEDYQDLPTVGQLEPARIADENPVVTDNVDTAFSSAHFGICLIWSFT